jgi:twinfilin
LAPHSGDVPLEEIYTQVPSDHPCYHLYRYDHEFEGQAQTANCACSPSAPRVSRAHNYCTTVFIYSCPGFKCPIKERMLFSACRNPLMECLEGDFQIVLAKKVLVGHYVRSSLAHQQCVHAHADGD